MSKSLEVRPGRRYRVTPTSIRFAAAREALHAVARLAARIGLNFLDARTAPGNEASRRALLAAGYHQVGELQTVTAPSGAVMIALTFERPVADFRFNA